MWFRNLQLYRLPADWRLDAERLEEQLGGQAFRPCGALDLQARGWLSPRGKAGGEGVATRLATVVGGQVLLALGSEHKLLPSSVVTQFAKERIAEFEEQNGYTPSRKQAKEIKEQVTDELLPRAFSRRTTTYVWIDPAHGRLAVDAASAAKADDVLEMLAKSLDNLALRPLHAKLPPSAAMTEWLSSGEAPAGFTIDRECELRNPLEENATVRYLRHPLESEEIRRHLEAGKLPTRVAMTWDDRISFVLTDHLDIKRLAFLDVLKEEAASGAENADEHFDAEFTLMAGELGRMIPDLLEALGGEDDGPI